MSNNSFLIEGTFDRIYISLRKLENLVCRYILPANDRYYDIHDLCKFFPGNPSTQNVIKWISDNNIPYLDFGHVKIVLKSDIDRVLHKFGKEAF